MTDSWWGQEQVPSWNLHDVNNKWKNLHLFLLNFIKNETKFPSIWNKIMIFSKTFWKNHVINHMIFSKWLIMINHFYEPWLCFLIKITIFIIARWVQIRSLPLYQFMIYHCHEMPGGKFKDLLPSASLPPKIDIR